MYYLLYESCREGRQIDECEMLDGHNRDEDGSFFHTGDEIIFDFRVNRNMGLALKKTSLPGVRVSLYTPFPEDNKEEQYDVELTFQVEKRSHSIRKDWIWKDSATALRVSDHTIWVKAQTVEAEDVFMWIRNDIVPDWIN